MSIKNKIYMFISLVILIAGFALYITWGIKYNTWLDIGIVCIVLFMVIAGIIGTIISYGLDIGEGRHEIPGSAQKN